MTRFSKSSEKINHFCSVLNKLGVDEPLTKADENVLKQFPGWGSFPDIHGRLDNILTDAEVVDALRAAPTSFYTPQPLARAIHEHLRRQGFVEGSMLEPGCGTGSGFIATIPPETAKKITVTAVERDKVAAKIARSFLGEKVDVLCDDFGSVELPANFYHLVLGNWPFGPYPPGKADNRYGAKSSMCLHEFFTLKAVDCLKPGGICAFVVTPGMLNRESRHIRDKIYDQAGFLGAVRLPSYFINEDTAIDGDVIFLQKRNKPRSQGGKAIKGESRDWLEAASVDSNGIAVATNEYFLRNPHMLLGETVVNRLYGGVTEGKVARGLVVSQDEPKETMERFVKALSEITIDTSLLQTFQTQPPQEWQDDKTSQEQQTHAKKFHFYKDTANQIKAWIRGERSTKDIVKVWKMFEESGGTAAETFSAFKKDPDSVLLQVASDKIAKMGKGSATFFAKEDVAQKRDTILTVSDAVGQSLQNFGKLDEHYLIKSLGLADRKNLLQAAEGAIVENPDTNTIEEREEYLSGNIRKKLGVAIIASGHDPKWSNNADLLRQVLPQEISFGEIDVTLGANLLAPEDYGEFFLRQIIGDEGFKRIQAQKLKEDPDLVSLIKFAQTPEGRWYAELTGEGKKKVVNESSWMRLGTKSHGGRTLTPLNLLIHAMNGTLPLKSKDKNSEKTAETIKRNIETQILSWKQRFQWYLNTNMEMQRKIIKNYNDRFCFVPRKPDGRHLSFPDMDPRWAKKMRPHQKDAIWLAISQNNAILSHQVGSGKTATQGGIAGELQRMGKARKPLIVVQKSTLGSFAKELREMYPKKEILVYPDKKNLSPRERGEFFAHAALTRDAIVVLTHDGYDSLEVSPSLREKMLAEELVSIKNFKSSLNANALPESLDSNEEPDTYRFSLQSLEKRIANLRAKIAKCREEQEDRRRIGAVEEFPTLEEKIAGERKGKLEGFEEYPWLDSGLEREEKKTVLARQKEKGRQIEKTERQHASVLSRKKHTDKAFYFDDMGFDALLVDESHRYKNLFTPTAFVGVKGVQTAHSKRSSLHKMKMDFFRKKGLPIVSSSGTHLSNTITELFSLQRMHMQEELDKMKIGSFDSWIKIFGNPQTRTELNVSGQFILTTRINEFQNLPELERMTQPLHRVGDETVSQFTSLPELISVPVVVETDPFVIRMMKKLAERMQNISRKRIDPQVDNPLKISTEGRLSALDSRLSPLQGELDGEREHTLDGRVILPPQPPDGKKTEAASRIVAKIYKENPDKTQLIFFDLGVRPTTLNPDFCFREDLIDRLVEEGIPREKIADFADVEGAQKDALQEKLRTGEKSIGIGSTEKLGTGVNVQHKLIALHHLDVPWTPTALVQRDGRAIRQGNENNKVMCYRYIVPLSADGRNWQIIENKKRFIQQAATGAGLDAQGRRYKDTNIEKITGGEFMALATGDPFSYELAQVKNDFQRLAFLREDYERGRLQRQSKIKEMQLRMGYIKTQLRNNAGDYEIARKSLDSSKAKRLLALHDDFKGIEVKSSNPAEQHGAGKEVKKGVFSGGMMVDALLAARKASQKKYGEILVGTYRSFPLYISKNEKGECIVVPFKNIKRNEKLIPLKGNHWEVGDVFFRLDWAIRDRTGEKKSFEKELSRYKTEIDLLEKEQKQPFYLESEFQRFSKRKNFLEKIIRVSDIESSQNETRVEQHLEDIARSYEENGAFFMKELERAIARWEKDKDDDAVTAVHFWRKKFLTTLPGFSRDRKFDLNEIPTPGAPRFTVGADKRNAKELKVPSKIDPQKDLSMFSGRGGFRNVLKNVHQQGMFADKKAMAFSLGEPEAEQESDARVVGVKDGFGIMRPGSMTRLEKAVEFDFEKGMPFYFDLKKMKQAGTLPKNFDANYDWINFIIAHASNRRDFWNGDEACLKEFELYREKFKYNSATEMPDNWRGDERGLDKELVEWFVSEKVKKIWLPQNIFYDEEGYPFAVCNGKREITFEEYKEQKIESARLEAEQKGIAFSDEDLQDEFDEYLMQMSRRGRRIGDPVSFIALTEKPDRMIFGTWERHSNDMHIGFCDIDGDVKSTFQKVSGNLKSASETEFQKNNERSPWRNYFLRPLRMGSINDPDEGFAFAQAAGLETPDGDVVSWRTMDGENECASEHWYGIFHAKRDGKYRILVLGRGLIENPEFLEARDARKFFDKMLARAVAAGNKEEKNHDRFDKDSFVQNYIFRALNEPILEIVNHVMEETKQEVEAEKKNLQGEGKTKFRLSAAQESNNKLPPGSLGDEISFSLGEEKHQQPQPLSKHKEGAIMSDSTATQPPSSSSQSESRTEEDKNERLGNLHKVDSSSYQAIGRRVEHSFAPGDILEWGENVYGRVKGNRELLGQRRIVARVVFHMTPKSSKGPEKKPTLALKPLSVTPISLSEGKRAEDIVEGIHLDMKQRGKIYRSAGTLTSARVLLKDEAQAFLDREVKDRAFGDQMGVSQENAKAEAPQIKNDLWRRLTANQKRDYFEESITKMKQGIREGVDTFLDPKTKMKRNIVLAAAAGAGVGVTSARILGDRIAPIAPQTTEAGQGVVGNIITDLPPSYNLGTGASSAYTPDHGAMTPNSEDLDAADSVVAGAQGSLSEAEQRFGVSPELGEQGASVSIPLATAGERSAVVEKVLQQGQEATSRDASADVFTGYDKAVSPGEDVMGQVYDINNPSLYPGEDTMSVFDVPEVDFFDRALAFFQSNITDRLKPWEGGEVEAQSLESLLTQESNSNGFGLEEKFADIAKKIDNFTISEGELTKWLFDEIVTPIRGLLGMDSPQLFEELYDPAHPANEFEGVYSPHSHPANEFEGVTSSEGENAGDEEALNNVLDDALEGTGVPSHNPEKEFEGLSPSPGEDTQSSPRFEVPEDFVDTLMVKIETNSMLSEKIDEAAELLTKVKGWFVKLYEKATGGLDDFLSQGGDVIVSQMQAVSFSLGLQSDDSRKGGKGGDIDAAYCYRTLRGEEKGTDGKKTEWIHRATSALALADMGKFNLLKHALQDANGEENSTRDKQIISAAIIGGGWNSPQRIKEIVLQVQTLSKDKRDHPIHLFVARKAHEHVLGNMEDCSDQELRTQLESRQEKSSVRKSAATSIKDADVLREIIVENKGGSANYAILALIQKSPDSVNEELVEISQKLKKSHPQHPVHKILQDSGNTKRLFNRKRTAKNTVVSSGTRVSRLSR